METPEAAPLRTTWALQGAQRKGSDFTYKRSGSHFAQGASTHPRNTLERGSVLSFLASPSLTTSLAVQGGEHLMDPNSFHLPQSSERGAVRVYYK
jgi:hypothetical protein